MRFGATAVGRLGWAPRRLAPLTRATRRAAAVVRGCRLPVAPVRAALDGEAPTVAGRGWLCGAVLYVPCVRPNC